MTGGPHPAPIPRSDAVFDLLRLGDGGTLSERDWTQVEAIREEFASFARELLKSGTAGNLLELTSAPGKNTIFRLYTNGRNLACLMTGENVKVLTPEERSSIDYHKDLMEGFSSDGQKLSLLRQPDFIERALVYSIEHDEEKTFLSHHVAHAREPYGTCDFQLENGRVSYLCEFRQGKRSTQMHERNATLLDFNELVAARDVLLPWAQQNRSA